MRGEFIAQHFGGELEGKPDAFAGRQPSHGGAIFHRGLGQQNHLIVSQGFKPLAHFRFQADGTAGTPALERVGGQDALFHERPIANCEKILGDNPGQLGAQGCGGETELVTVGNSSAHVMVALGG